MSAEGLMLAVLFVSGEPVPVRDLCAWTGMSRSDVDVAIAKMEADAKEGAGLTPVRIGDSIQLATNPEYADTLHAIFAPPPERRLSNSVLETLAVIAYSQPVTRLEIEEIRGVRSSYALSVLCRKGLVKRVGTKDVLGHPSLYETTDVFLRQFGLESLEELPPLSTLRGSRPSRAQTYPRKLKKLSKE